KNFIDGFFDLTGLDTKLTNINAVVGQNGAGKSTVLDIIRSKFIEHQYALPQSRFLFLFELDNADEPIVVRNDFRERSIAELQYVIEKPIKKGFDKFFLVKNETTKVELNQPLQKKI